MALVPRIPILSRLSFNEYVSLFLTFIIFLTEPIFRFIVSFIPPHFFIGKEDESKKHKFRDAWDFAKFWGCDIVQHVVKTDDGYVLGIHRLTLKNEKFNKAKPAVLLWHGLLMNSEIFMCRPDIENNIAHFLLHKGYDIWLGNSRGNKYSYKHRSKKPNSIEFWDFSLDELSLIDVSNTINFILEKTGRSSISYIGFSQGTALAFAALSNYNELNEKINIFISLAPATTPRGITNRFVTGMIKASPNLIYLIFGRREALSLALFWQSILPRTLYVKAIDMSLNMLFNWKAQNMTFQVKKQCYQHLYSYTSVKCLVHWFQIIISGKFQYYNDNPDSSGLQVTSHVSHQFPTLEIQTPLVIFFGGSDSLSDMELFFSCIPKPLFSKEVPEYEHLDFLWAHSLKDDVFPDLLKYIEMKNI